MNVSVRSFLAAAAFLAAAPVSAQTPTWTFTPTLKRLDASDNVLTGEINLRERSESLRIGVYIDVSTSASGSTDFIGVDRISGIFHFTGSGGLTDAQIAAVVEDVPRPPRLEGSQPEGAIGWRTRTTDTTFSSRNDLIRFPPDTGETSIAIGPTQPPPPDEDPRGAWCRPSSGSCEIFLGVITLPLTDMPETAGGVLSVKWADDALNENVNFRTMLNRGIESIQEGNTIQYRVCPMAGCPVTVNFASSTYSVPEGDTGADNTVGVTLSLSEPYSSAVTVPITVGTVSTAPTGAYNLPSSSEVTFEIGETSKTFTVTTVGNDDDAADAAEAQTLVLEFGTLPSSVAAGTTDSTTITINDDDFPAATVAFGAANYVAIEGGGAVVTVTLTAPTAPATLEREVVVPITTTTVGGASAADFDGVPATLTFASGSTGMTSQTFTVLATDDSDMDTGESITLGFGTLPRDMSAVSPSTTSVALRDNDSDLVELSVASMSSVTENGGAQTVTVTGTLRVYSVSTLSDAITVSLGTTGTATSDTDYTLTTAGILTFASGAAPDSTVTADLVVTTLDDDVVEAVETIIVTGTPTGILTAVEPSAAIDLTDDDTATVSIAAGAASVEEEADTSVTFTATLSKQVATALTVSWSATTDDSSSTVDADPDADLGAKSGSIVIAAGDTTQTFSVDIENDALSEVDEVFRTALGGITGAPARTSSGSPVDTVTVSSGSGAVDVTITKNDPLTVGLEALGALVEGRSASFTLRVTGGISTNDVIATVTAVLGTEGGSDPQMNPPTETGCLGGAEICWDDDGDAATARVAVPSGGIAVTIPAGQGTVTYNRIYVADDGEGDADDVLTITVTSAEGGRGSDSNTDGIGVATGADPAASRNGPVREAFIAALGPVEDASQGEGDEFTIPVVVSVDETPAADLVVRYEFGVDEDDATDDATDEDYVDPGSGAVTIPMAQCSPTECVTNIRVGVVNDELSESEETFTVNLNALAYADGVTTGRRALALGAAAEITETLTIEVDRDDDFTVSFSGRVPETVREGTVVPFTVSLVGGLSPQAVTVTIGYLRDLSDANAAAMGAMRGATFGEDFTFVGGGIAVTDGYQVVIPAGQRSTAFQLRFIREAGAADAGPAIREGRELATFGILRVGGEVREGAPAFFDPSAPPTIMTTIVEVNLEERGRAMKHTLAVFGRTMATGLIDAIEDRAAASHSFEGSRVTLAGETLSVDTFRFLDGGTGSGLAEAEDEPGDGGTALAGSIERLLGVTTDGLGGASIDPVSTSELLSGSSFQLSQGGGDGAAGTGSWGLWGQGARTAFESRKNDLSMEGDVLSGYMGMDFRMREDVLAGIALSYGKGDTDYRFSGASGTAGKIETTLTSVHPYAHWSPQAGLGLWATAGYGWGDAELDDGDSDPVKTDLKMTMGAVGGRQALASAGGMDWSLKADAFIVQVEAEERVEDLPAVKSDSHRMRLAVEGDRSVELGEGRTLSGSIEFGGRLDGGDADEGLGAEVGGGISYANTDLGFDVEARGRSLLAHGAGGFEEWGASLAAKFDPGVAGRGLHMSIQPSWGSATSGVDSLWGDAAVTETRSGSGEVADSSPDMVMAAQAGYGMGLMDDRGLLTPFGAMDLSGGSSRVRLGTRFTLSAPRNVGFKFELYGEQENGAGESVSGRSFAFDSRVERSFGEDAGAVELFSKLQAGGAKDHEVGLRARVNF